LSDLQPPWPLQSFLPLQACFAAGMAGVADVPGVAGIAVDGVEGVLGTADDGSVTPGALGAPPQAVAPRAIPPMAATSKE
jgi:hypothetical protein